MLNEASQESQYRAWHKEDKYMYHVLGIDWFNRKILISTNGFVRWHQKDLFILMKKSGLRDKSRTPGYPEGKNIYEGDIVQFPILLSGDDGVTRETVVKDVVEFDDGQFTLSEFTDFDLLALYNDECEIIGTVYENPGLISKAE